MLNSEPLEDSQSPYGVLIVVQMELILECLAVLFQQMAD